MDENGYPEDHELETIRNYPGNDLEGMIRLIMPVFSGYGTIRCENGLYFLSTGGWSGNEEIIEAMRGNKNHWWFFHWLASRRGGHFAFGQPSLAISERLII